MADAINIKKLLAERLKAIAQNISSKDKLDASSFLDISRPTLARYLEGDVVKIDTAEKLIKFFAAKIESRMNVLRETNVI